MNLPFKLVSTDFDGTLHAEFETPPVPQDLQDLIGELQRQGVRWIINTGRDLSSLMEGMARARLTIRPDYVVVVEREIYVTSNPPGALVWANDQEIGRTPLARDFTWYGTYDVVVRKDGCEPLHTKTKVIAPWWQWPPIDLAVEVLPGHWVDRREIRYDLKPASTQPADPELMLNRAEQLRIRLEGSQYTRNPATVPVTKPSTTQASQPATTQVAK